LVWWSTSDAWTTGLPDIMAVYRGRFCAIELKAEDGHLSQRQKEWLVQFAKAGGYACVVRAAPGRGPLQAVLTEMGMVEPIELSQDWLLARLEL
jgi:Holliday junction resolvase